MLYQVTVRNEQDVWIGWYLVYSTDGIINAMDKALSKCWMENPVHDWESLHVADAHEFDACDIGVFVP